MLNNIILVVLVICFFWAVSYAYGCIKEEVEKTKTNKDDKLKMELTPEEVVQQFSALMANGEAGEAQKLAKRYLCFDSHHHDLRKMLAESYIETNKEYDAITHLSVLSRVFPDDMNITRNLATLYQKTRQSKKAIHYYTLILEKNKDDITSMRNLADLYYQNKQKESALKLYKQLAFLVNDEAEKTYYNEVIGSIYSSYGEYDRAIGLYEKVLEVKPDSTEIIRDLRRIYLKQKNTQKVIDYSQKLIELEPGNYLYYEDLINLFFHVKEYDKALSYAQRALNLPDANAEDLNNLIAKVYINTGRIQEAVDLINETLLSCPENTVLAQTLALAYCMDKDFEMAKKVCNDSLQVAVPSEVKSIRNNLSTILAEEAVFLLSEEKTKEAFEKFNEALKYNSENPEIYLKLSDANKTIKNIPEAVRQCKRAIELAPQNSGYYEKLGDIYYELQNFFDAKKLYKDAVSIDPKNARAHTFLGIIQVKDKEYEPAVKSLETAVELDSANPDIIYNLGLAYEYAGRKDEAKQRYEEVLSINPEHKEAANNLRLL